MDKNSEVYKNLEKVVIINTILTAVENAGFMLAGLWDIKVLIGSIWGLTIACIYFYMICVSITSALRLDDTEIATKMVRQGQRERMLVIVIGVIASFYIPFIYWPRALIPLLFTRISILFIGFGKGDKE